ncbi:MAG: hypothetical protein Q4B65_01700 [Candidatus Saccharibacteria bacterium]|nr:hypothetical protein [Candidatus Saccharibacteria bacterium]
MKKTKLLKSLALVGTASTLALSSTGVFAWGPERPTFTMAEPASYPTFNSITDNPVLGDERDFVRVGEIDAKETDLKNEIEVIPGKQYLVYLYFHNNASAVYNDSAHGNAGVALGTRMATSFSTVLTPSEKGTITGTVTADNSNPGSVWDEAYMTTTYKKVLLSYVEGSAKIYSDWGASGSVMPSSLFTEGGALVGLNELNGVIPGCEEYSGVVSYVLQAEELEGTIEKTVSKDGVNYGTSLSAGLGDEVYYKLTIKNGGDVELTNAVITDTLPESLELVDGSVELSANDSETKDKLSDNIIGTGYNLGTIGTGNTVYITYRAKVIDDKDCTLVNNAKLTYDSDISKGDTDESSATVNINKEECTLPTEIVSTGPLEIALAVIIILGIGGGIFYLWKTRKTLKTVEDVVSGKAPEEKPEDKDKPTE